MTPPNKKATADKCVHTSKCLQDRMIVGACCHEYSTKRLHSSDEAQNKAEELGDKIIFGIILILSAFFVLAAISPMFTL